MKKDFPIISFREGLADEWTARIVSLEIMAVIFRVKSARNVIPEIVADKWTARNTSFVIVADGWTARTASFVIMADEWSARIINLMTLAVVCKFGFKNKSLPGTYFFS